MNNRKSILQVGCGKMGSIWTNAWLKTSGKLCGIIDPDPPDESRKKFDSDLFYTSMDSYRNDNMAPNIDILSIAVPTEYHKKYLEYGIDKNISQIIVEKPSTKSVAHSRKINKKAKNTQVSVDYIETKHTVLETIKEKITTDFELTRAFHWRGKTPRNFNPYIRDDLIHDISELQFIYNILDRDFSDINVVGANIYSWEKTDRFMDIKQDRTAVDVNANVKLNGAQDESLHIRGGFDEPNERRYFIWIDDTNNVAYLGNTVNRSNITPVVAKITGENNIEIAYEWCNKGELTSDIAFSKLFEKVNAHTFELDEYSKQVQTITTEICNSKISPVSLSDAVQIESLAADIYSAGSFSKPE